MNRLVRRHDGPATWDSSVRGLMLGLALGDAIGSRASDLPDSGALEAGVATQLAAWTTEGLLRTATRYGGHILGNPQTCVRHAYQRWALLRGATPQTDNWMPLPEPGDVAPRGWLIDVPAMAEQRGSSPSTLAGLVDGRPTSSAGCQAMLRGLPIAALVGPAVREPKRREPLLEGVGDFARKVSGMTHDHPASCAAARLRCAARGRVPVGDGVVRVSTSAVSRRTGG